MLPEKERKGRVNLTDKALKAMKPAPAGTDRYEVADAIVPGLRVRVNEAGRKTFVLLARFPISTTGKRKPRVDGKINPTRRTIGVYVEGGVTGRSNSKEGGDAPIGSLGDARKTARQWHELLSQGIDPQTLIAETRARERIRQDNSFGFVVEEYLKTAVLGPDEKNPLMRVGKEIARNLRVEFVNDKWETGQKGAGQAAGGKGKKRPGLGPRPISGITKQDILAVVDAAIARGSRTMAHNLLAHVRMLFNWAIDSGRFGIEASPCDRIKPKSVIGRKTKRKRVLSDAELRAVWAASEKIGYPYGPIYQLLLLTGLRKGEVSDAPRREFDLARKMWTIPKERMKMDNDHHVPLSDLACAVLQKLPQFERSAFAFSTSLGAKPVNGFSKAKTILDRTMLNEMRRAVAEEGGDPEEVTLQPFVIHDIRRTVRTRLSALGVNRVVAELILAHAQKDLDAVYDQHAFIDERRQALDKWAMAMRSIVAPTSGNVISFEARQNAKQLT
ncbi:tyrosine-type recombinase/integrase [Rhizobium sp. YIM 134829]|uniref:tyrosine-type recombinase/integrase n=1 Tax=Rhizobium sp. YIM 134829 TaxID=3390453 RepID=UPI00397AB008